MDRQRVFSGLQPTGNVHLGNYLGALRNWVKLQDSYDCVYCVVDLHAITVDYDPKQFARDRIEAAKVLMACGIDPDRSLFYFQSQVPQHSELAWILGTMTPTGVLNRMTQYKDKVARGEAANLGLYSYPVLMAADILLYHANLVPIGDDQRQHLGDDPRSRRAIQQPVREGLPDPGCSDPGDDGAGDVVHRPDVEDVEVGSRTRRAVCSSSILRMWSGRRSRSAVTDSDPEVRFDPIEQARHLEPARDHVLVHRPHYRRSRRLSMPTVATASSRSAVAEAVIAELAPIRSAYQNLDDSEVARIMRRGALDARTKAEGYQQIVREATGLAAV